MRGGRTLRAAVLAVALAANVGGAVAADCDPAVSSVLDKQRQAFINAQADMADQNFSKRPGTFASTTCLDNLMKGGGLDIFFKPPSLDNILGMVKNLACKQASQIFNSLMGGGGINGGSILKAGEIISGTNLGGNLVQFSPKSISSGNVSGASLRGLFQ